MYLDDLYHHLKGTNTGAVRRLWIKLRLKERVVLAEPISFIHISLCIYIYIHRYEMITHKEVAHMHIYICIHIYIHICILVESCRCLSVFHCQRTLYIYICCNVYIYTHIHTLFSIYVYRDIVACF